MVPMAKLGYFASRCKARLWRAAENSRSAAIARPSRLWAACPLKKAVGGDFHDKGKTGRTGYDKRTATGLPQS